jgi:hypothetical protein
VEPNDNRTYARAELYQILLKQTQTLTPVEAGRIHAKLPRGFAKRLSEMNALDWIPAEEYGTLERAVASTLGAVEAFKFFRESATVAANKSALLSGLILILRKVGVIHPRMIIKVLPSSFGNTLRNAGKFKVIDEGHPKQMKLEWDDLPEWYLKEQFSLEAMRGALCALFDTCNVDGSIEMMVHRAQRRAVLLFSWK